MADNQKRVYSTNGHHSVTPECRVKVLFLCPSSDEAVYLYKILRIHLKRLLRCEAQIYIFDGFKNDTVDTIFKLKTSKGIILLEFRCSYDSCSLQIF